MKKIFLLLIVCVVICLSYLHKSPIISSEEALIEAEKYLLNPPKEWKLPSTFYGLEEVPEENINVILSKKGGYWNEIFNRMNWEVTIKVSGMEATVMIDAHTGDFITIYGPLN